MLRKISLLTSLIMLILALGVNAQKKKKTAPPKAAPTNSSGYGSGGSGYGNPPSSGYGNPSSSGYGSSSTSGYGSSSSSGYGATNNNQPQQTNQPKPNIPYEVVKSKGNPALDSILPSLRPDASIERTLNKDRQPLDFEHIREDDAVFRHRIWREIDTREKMNLAFRYANNEDNGNQRFISILLKAIRERKVTAFDGSDDRFTMPLTPDQVIKKFSGGLDTVPVEDDNGDVYKYKIMPKEIDPDSIYRFRLKEEWVFDKESSRLFVRILGIAPLKRLTKSDGTDLDPSNPDYEALFWVYYPNTPNESLRAFLSKYEAYNGKNFGGRMSWEELFENRLFSSYITKSSIDNPFDRSLKYIKDPVLRLLEGENIKEKIFSYEQDQWSY